MDSGGCDDLEKFFRRPPDAVSNSDILRWRAAVEAVRAGME
jgi:hypothetical protein